MNRELLKLEEKLGESCAKNKNLTALNTELLKQLKDARNKVSDTSVSCDKTPLRLHIHQDHENVSDDESMSENKIIEGEPKLQHEDSKLDEGKLQKLKKRQYVYW